MSRRKSNALKPHVISQKQSGLLPAIRPTPCLTPLFKRAPLGVFAVSLGLTAISSLSFAQTLPPDSAPTSKETQLSTVTVKADGTDATRDYQPVVSTVGGKTVTALTDIPQTVTVVNKALMQAQGATSLADALRNVPGITLGGAEGGQIGNNINLRGFTARTDIYIDGFRDRGQYYRDVFALEQVEVLQGPSSMLFGRGSTGGVINQVTKKAQLGQFTDVSGTIGTDGRLRTTLDTNSTISETAALRVNVFGQDLQTTRDTMKNKDFGFAPTLTLGIGQSTEITLSGLLQHNNDMPDYGAQSLNGSPITASRNTYYGESSDHTDQNIAMINAVVTHHINASMTLRNQTQINHYTTDAVETAAHALGTLSGSTFTALATPAFGNYQPAQLWVQMQSHDRNIIDNSVDNQTDLISKFATGFIHHELIVGLELGRDKYTNQAYSRTGTGAGGTGFVNFISLLNPSAASPSGVTTTTGNLAASSANSLGFYANDTLSFGEQWKFVTGVRHDRFSGEINNSITAPVGQSSQTSRFTSYREGLLYQPDEDQSYYLSYGTSFDPLLEQMTLTNGTQGLPPTNTRSFEVGSKWLVLDDRLSLAAAAFRELQNNVYTRDASGIYQAAGNWLIKGYTLSATGRLTDHLQISTGYMHLVPRVVHTLDATNGSTPANTPKNTLTVWASYDVTPNWEVGGGPNYMSHRFVADSAPASVDVVSVPSYTRWDATVAYHQPSYEIRLNLLNFGNKFYYDALIPSDGGRAVPGIGRTALLTGTYHFH